MFGEPRNAAEAAICELQKKRDQLRKEILEKYKELPPEEITDYELTLLDGRKTKLSQVFGSHEEMLLVHNMGPQCPYCTLWADGFNSALPYLESRAAFVLETDRPAETLRSFKEARGWKFTTVSTADTTLKKDLGFQNEKMNLPGVSSLYKKDGKIYRHATAPFGPGDEFCSTWHFFDLLKKGADGWEPKFNQ